MHLVKTLLAAIALALAIAPAAGAATILPAQAIDGPDSAIEDLGGVAMSADGTGGLVFRKRVAGKLHVFASLFRGGAWSAPQRVDADLDPGDGLEFDAHSPRIAAGARGQLVVVWAQDYGSSDQLYSASLDPGATLFEAPVAIDLNVGDGSQVFPSVAMNRGGQAFVVYRVVTAVSGGSNTSIPPGYALAELRAARYVGWTWSRFDQLLNRNPSVSVRLPDAGNAPKVVIDEAGSAVVAFQEPDDTFIDRIYVRRLFSGVLGLAQQASPSIWEGKPLRGIADQISLDGGQYGNAALIYRQTAGPSSGLDRDRVFANLLAPTYTGEAARIGAPRLIDNAPGGNASSGTAAAVSRERFAGIFGQGGTAILAGGTTDTLDPLAGAGAASSPVDPGVDLSDGGRMVGAWIGPSAGRAGLRVRATAEDGSATESGALLADGDVTTARLAGSGLGDAAVGFAQDSGGGRIIGAQIVDAPPTTPGLLGLPKSTRTKRWMLRWLPAANAIGGLSYLIYVNGRQVGSTSGTEFRLSKLREGKRRVRVVAIDRLGQQTRSPSGVLLVDRRKPGLRLRRIGGRRIVARVLVGPHSRSSRISQRSRINWGDGSSSRIRSQATHRYKRSGSVRVVARLRDGAGNRITIRRTVRP